MKKIATYWAVGGIGTSEILLNVVYKADNWSSDSFSHFFNIFGFWSAEKVKNGLIKVRKLWKMKKIATYWAVGGIGTSEILLINVVYKADNWSSDSFSHFFNILGFWSAEKVKNGPKSQKIVENDEHRNLLV